MKEKNAIWILIWGGAALVSGAVLWLFGKYILIGIMPFIIAYGISLVLRPASLWLSKKTGVPHKFCASFLVIVTMSLAALLISSLGTKLISEGQGLMVTISGSLEDENNIIRRTIYFFTNLRGKLPFLTDVEMGDSLYEGIVSLLKDALSGISASLAQSAASVIKGLPGFIFAIVTTVIALFYLSLDTGGIGVELCAFTGNQTLDKIKNGNKRIIGALAKYLKSYFFILILTFSELFAGFAVLRINYAFMLALVIALIDLLPVIGSGMILIPWGLLSLAIGKFKIGVGLLVLWAIMYIVRQIAEPKIIGSVMGIHPLFSLFALYIGYVFFGVWGMIFLPITINIAKAVIADKNSTAAQSPSS